MYTRLFTHLNPFNVCLDSPTTLIIRFRGARRHVASSASSLGPARVAVDPVSFVLDRDTRQNCRYQAINRFHLLSNLGSSAIPHDGLNREERACLCPRLLDAGPPLTTELPPSPTRLAAPCVIGLASETWRGGGELLEYTNKRQTEGGADAGVC